MRGSTLTIRRDASGKIKCVTASGTYAMELFKTMQQTTVAKKPNEVAPKKD